MEKGVPVIIRNHEPATTFAAKWSMKRIEEECGYMRPNFGIRVLSFLENMGPELTAVFDDRIREISEGKITLETLMATMGGSEFTTLKEYLNSRHFRGDIANQTKDWMHPSDYLLPVSVHSISVADCEGMYKSLLSVHRRHPLAYGESLFQPDLHMPPKSTDSIINFFVFVGPDRSRAYNPHRHGVPNFTLMLQVTGYKHTVVWPDEESKNLYQVKDLAPKENEVSEFPAIYQVDGINVDYDKQPDLRKVSKSWEGVAAPGDLLFIPCGIPHTVENRGESVAVGWFPSGFDMNCVGDTMCETEVPHCPNLNAAEYKCSSEKREVKGMSRMKNKQSNFFQCDVKGKS